MESSVGAIIVIALSIVASALIWRNGITIGGVQQQDSLLYIFYGVALCGIGQLTLTGNNISMDAFGPVSDNANGIGEMAGLEPKARQTLADLDAVGNTTKAITKGIAIASAVLAAVALFASFKYEYQLQTIDLIQWKVFVAFLIGGAIPFLFSSLTHQRRGTSRLLHCQRSTLAVRQRQGHLGRHDRPGLRQGSHHRHLGRPEGTPHSGPASPSFRRS